MTRADVRTFNRIKPIYYSDFTDNFDLNPQTGLLAMVNNEADVIQSIKNLVFTNMYERPYQPTIGSKVQSLNFELNDTVTQQLLQQTLLETIRTYEPRALDVAIVVQPDADNNAITISVIFSLKNINNPINFSFVLPRVR